MYAIMYFILSRYDIYMPKTIHDIDQNTIELLNDVGCKVQQFRKSHKLTQAILAESLEIDRRTLAKLERGDLTISLGTALHILRNLGFAVTVYSPSEKETADEALDKHYLPMQINLADYPVLKRCAWQLKAEDSVTPPIAYKLYQDKQSDFAKGNMSRKEQRLFACLELVYGSL